MPFKLLHGGDVLKCKFSPIFIQIYDSLRRRKFNYGCGCGKFVFKQYDELMIRIICYLKAKAFSENVYEFLFISKNAINDLFINSFSSFVGGDILVKLDKEDALSRELDIHDCLLETFEQSDQNDRLIVNRIQQLNQTNDANSDEIENCFPIELKKDDFIGLSEYNPLQDEDVLISELEILPHESVQMLIEQAEREFSDPTVLKRYCRELKFVT